MASAVARLSKRLVILPAAMIALGLAACGDDDEGTASPTSTSSAGSSGLSVEVDPSAVAAGGTLQARVRNDGEAPYTYGLAYEIDHAIAGGWEPVDLPQRPVAMIGLVAEPGEVGPPVDVELPGDLGPGPYRVVIARDVPDVGDLVGEFEISK